MKKNTSLILNGLFVLVTAVLFTACKENTIIKTDVVPAVDNITVFGTDTFARYINTKSVINDSFITSSYASGLSVYMGAGSINSDPFFGKTVANFYFQVRPPQVSFTFDKAKYKADSAVLILPYSGFTWGDTMSMSNITYSAYRITESFNKDTVYYSSSPALATESTPIGSTTVSAYSLHRSRYDSTQVLGTKRSPHMRMRLTQDVLDTLINNAGGSNYTDYPAFLNWFRGIYITSNNGGNAIPYFRLTGGDVYGTAGIMIYYHTINSGGNITDTLGSSFLFDPTVTGFFNKVSHDYSGTPASSYFNSTATTDNIILIQNLPGASADLHFTFTKTFPRCVINKAELIITQVSSPMDGVFFPPVRIFPNGVSESGELYTIADRYPLTSSDPLAFIDGNVRTAIVGGTTVYQYVVNIPRELQRAIAEQRKELRLRINGSPTFAGAYRLVVGGSNYSQPQYRVKLNIVYTKL